MDFKNASPKFLSQSVYAIEMILVGFIVQSKIGMYQL